MKQFLQTNTITYNLMSFTAFKSVLIFSLLLEGPKSYQDLKSAIENHEYLHEKVSVDTIRIYINSLKEFGCNILKKRYDGITKYSIDKHPFTLKFDDKQVKNIIKIYKAISNSIEIQDLIAFQHFFKKIAQYVDNENLKTKLINISPLNNIDSQLINNLMKYAQHNTEITMYYNSANSGRKNITIVVDKLFIENGKAYVSGFNSEYNNYSSFLISKIINIVSVNLQNNILNIPDITVGYEYIKDDKEDFILLNNEKLINSDNNKLVIEITSKNKFSILQRIMYHASKCTVLYPQDFRKYVITNLKNMKEGYIEK